MKKTALVALALSIMAASGCMLSVCNPGTASVAELTKAAKHCYTLQHSPYDLKAFDKFTVKDLEVISKTRTPYGTVWSVRAKLYDPNNQYVEDIAQSMIKMSLGSWSCQ